MNAADNGFKLRASVDDFAVWQNVVARNEYGLPPRFHPASVIVDVGAHIGCFAMAAYRRGARRIFCFEADAKNYEQLVENVKGLHGASVTPLNLAVWRSDLSVKWNRYLNFTDSELKNVGGGGNVLLDRPDGKEVNAVSFDAVVNQATNFGAERVFMAKFDCEGSEWPILLTSTLLDLVDWIVGEYHEIGGPNMKYVRDDQIHPTVIPEIARVPGWSEYTAEGLKNFLTGKGFSVTVTPSRHLPWLGKFSAVRR